MEGTPEARSGGRHDRLSGLQQHFLARLERLLRLRHQQMGAMTVELVRLLDQAIYSTYCDCLDLGVGGQAQELIRRYQTSSAGEHPTN
jgi:hypothetical protein